MQLRDEAELRRRIVDQQYKCRQLVSRINLADLDLKEANDVIDEKALRDEDASEQDHSNVENCARELESLQADHSAATTELEELQRVLQDTRMKKLNQQQFNPEAAAEVMRLLQACDCYSRMIESAKDEMELKDISDFIFLLLKGTESKHSIKSTTSAKRAKSLIETANVLSAQKQSRNADNIEDSILFDISESAPNTDSQAYKFNADEDDTMGESQPGPKHSNNATKGQLDSSMDVDKVIDDDNDEEDILDDELVDLDDPATPSFAKLRQHKLSGGSGYDRYRRVLQLREYVELFTIPACEYGYSLRTNSKTEPPPTYHLSPEAAATKYINYDPKILKNERSVVRAALSIVSMEYSHEPNIKKLSREIFINEGTLSTRPTEKGLAVITAYNELFGLHYLDRKPIRDFFYGRDKSLFLRLHDAERNGLITITINLPESTGSAVMNTEADPYAKTVHLFLGEKKFFHFFVPSLEKHRDANPESRQGWDHLRMEVLKMVFEKHLFPMLLKEMKRDLIKHAREAALEEVSTNFAAKLQLGPYIPPITNTREHYKNLLVNSPHPTTHRKALGIFLSNNLREPIFMCYVDAEGVLKSHSLIPAVLSQSKKNDHIQKFIFEHEPEIIVLNASAGMASKTFQSLLEKSLLPELDKKVREKRRLKYDNQYRDDEDEVDDEDNAPYNPSVLTFILTTQL